MWILMVFSFVLGMVVGGLIVYKNIDLVVQERYRKYRRRRDDDDR